MLNGYLKYVNGIIEELCYLKDSKMENSNKYKILSNELKEILSDDDKFINDNIIPVKKDNRKLVKSVNIVIF